jgi:lipoprotein-releasing system ATP-binding protein
VFQSHHLIPVLTLRENVEAALIHSPHLSTAERCQTAENLLAELGLEQRSHAKAARVSAGERQRAAIARALANSPSLILADEPTGNVDARTARLILNHLLKYVESEQRSILIATHDEQVSALADVILSMDDGRIIATATKTGEHDAN